MEIIVEFFQGSYSIFLWNNDKCKRIIHNNPSCPIPLMQVNEGEEDEITALLAGGPTDASPTFSVKDWNNSLSDVAQQTTKDGLLLPVGHVVRYYDNNKMKLCTIVDNEKKLNEFPASKIRTLNSDMEKTVPNSEITSITEPEPSTIPQSANEVNPSLMGSIWKKIKHLWDMKDSDFTDD